MVVFNPKDVDRELEQQNNALVVKPFVEPGAGVPAVRKPDLAMMPVRPGLVSADREPM
jgi:hypothetical protein